MTSVESKSPAAGSYRRAEDAVVRRLTRMFDAFTLRTFAVHQAALLRMGYGLIFLFGLLREYVNRREIWGDRSAWSPAMARQLLENIDGVSLLLASDERWWFELVYVLAIVTTALFVLGWHTRAMGVLFAVMVVSFNSRSILMTDGGDTVLLLMSIYLAFTACGRVWSLDARRAKRTGIGPGTGPGRELGVFVGLFAILVLALTLSWEWAVLIAPVLVGLWRLPRPAEQLRGVLVNVVHNCALFVIAAEVCFVYGAAGLFKVQGSYWQDGTAMHYVLNLEYFAPWPAFSEQLASNTGMGMVICYLTVFVQIGFVFLVFAKRAKYVAIVILLGMHFGIAILLGLPAFSAAMSVGDALFLPTAFLMWTRGHVVRTVRRRLGGTPTPTAAPTPTVPAPTQAPEDATPTLAR
ncbi:HTTM domain-containing protein [Streptomyces sp. SID3343]|uniref:HTTM domain-containing protein n=1 Tax=Streptomyces sp. SID3343 TaxID=2690260 RepID=UPI00136C6932|nr:HTTM domain-containing protein [Streptomyces sp. SID3343]MYW01836.1 HTTM domain-containing protein [Streptomyces sp. SID3343]